MEIKKYQSINIDEQTIKNHTKTGKKIQKLAAKVNEIIIEEHNCDLMNGGCLLFAEILEEIYKKENKKSNKYKKIEKVIVGRKDNIDHIVLKIIDKYNNIYYIDADGIANEEEVIDKMIFLEQLPNTENNPIIIKKIGTNNIPENYGIINKKYNEEKTKEKIMKILSNIFKKEIKIKQLK